MKPFRWYCMHPSNYCQPSQSHAECVSGSGRTPAFQEVGALAAEHCRDTNLNATTIFRKPVSLDKNSSHPDDTSSALSTVQPQKQQAIASWQFHLALPGCRLATDIGAGLIRLNLSQRISAPRIPRHAYSMGAPYRNEIRDHGYRAGVAGCREAGLDPVVRTDSLSDLAIYADQAVASLVPSGRSTMGKWTMAENAPTPTPIHHTRS